MKLILEKREVVRLEVEAIKANYGKAIWEVVREEVESIEAYFGKEIWEVVS